MKEDRQTEKQERKIDRLNSCQAVRRTGVQTDRHADRQVGMKADRQTGKQERKIDRLNSCQFSTPQIFCFVRNYFEGKSSLRTSNKKGVP